MQRLHFPWRMRPDPTWQRLCLVPLICIAVWLAGCAAPPKPAPVPPEPVKPAPVAPAPAPPKPEPAPPVAVAPEPEAVQLPLPRASDANNPRDYRKDAAAHLYQKYASRIYPGKMPPLLEAVGVLELDIGRRGEILALRWTRPPTHVPQVMAQIESLVHAAAPFPAATRMGKLSYTEVWLWHKSGRFQLDSLTEGQK